MDSGSGPDGPPEERDHRDDTVALALTRLSALTAPTAEERDRVRARILAGLDAEPTEPRADGAATPNRPRNATGGRGPRARRPAAGRTTDRPRIMSGARGRFAVAAVAVLALVGSLAGMSLLLARDALPGDALYGVKRSAEAASLGLTFGDESKAFKHLEFATARVDEVETLARRYPNPDDAPVGGYLTALTDFDNDAAAGSRQLIALATRADGSQLDALHDWAARQTGRLTAVTRALPSAARSRHGVTLALLDRITTRATALRSRLDCYQITSGDHDEIGALPATADCDQTPDTGPGATAPPPSVSGQPDDPGAPPPPASSGPLPPVEPTPDAPLLPVPGTTVSVPAPTGPPTTPAPGATPGQPSVQVPLPLPGVELPPLLPGLPALRIGE